MATLTVGAGETYSTIQAAINDAVDGDTILVAAGIYDEDLVIDKGVTIRGAQADIAVGGRDAAAGSGETTIIGHAQVTATANVTLNGLRFLNDSTTTGGGPAVRFTTGGGVVGHLVTDSIFWSSVAGAVGDDRALFAQVISDGLITITDNFISGTSQAMFGTASWGRGIWFDGGGVDLAVTGNRIEWTRTGLNLDMSGDSTANVSNNDFRNLGSGIAVGVDSDGLTVSGNDVTNVGTDFSFRNLTTGVTFDAGTAIDTLTPVGNASDIILVLGGSGNDDLTGTAGADYIDANNNPVNPNAGDADLVNGAGGNDILLGRGGDDILDGGTGDDAMTGGTGNDVYVVDSGGDTVTEASGQGTDEVRTSLSSYTLAADLENLTGLGSVDQSLTGNGGDNVLTGGGGNDAIDGAGGVDTARYTGPATVATNGSGGWTVTDSGGSDSLSNVEIVDDDAGGRILLVGNGGYSSIQAAVNAAADGDTILVAAGTYFEQVDVNNLDNLTIRGVGGTVTIKAPADLVETARSGSDREIHALLTVENSLNVAIDNIDVDGDGRGNTVDEGGGAGQANFYGIFYRNSSGSLLDVDVTGVRDSYPGGTTSGGNPLVSGTQRGVGVVVDNATRLAFTMTGGSITDFQKNATVFNGAILDVTGVTITGGGAQTVNAQNGIQVTNSTGTISGNTITGIGYAGTQNAYSAAVLAFGNTDLDIQDNIIVGTNDEDTDAKVVGIYVLDFGTPSSGGSISGNTISHIDEGIVVTGDITPNGILIENNEVTDIDGHDNDPVAVYFEPSPAFPTAHDVDGTEQDDVLTGGAGNDDLSGLGGNDALTGNGGNDILRGDGDSDSAHYAGPRGDYSYTYTTGPGGRVTGFTSVTDNNAGNGDEGSDILTGIETLVFAGQVLDLGQAVQLFNGGGTLVATFDTIQAAVDAAANGETIRVGAGTYNEVVNLNKDVTVEGPNRGIAGTAARSAEAIVNGGFYITAAGATIDGLRLDNGAGSVGGEAAGIHVGADDVTLTNMIFDGAGTPGMPAIVTPYNGGITGLLLTDSLIAGWARGAYLNPTTQFTATGNSFDSNGNAIIGDDWDDTSLIDDNSFTNSAGSHIGYGAVDTVEDVGAFFGTGNTFGGTNRPTSIFAYGDGTAAAQAVHGTELSNLIRGEAAGESYVFRGRGGNDLLQGNAGDDSLHGDSGNDDLRGGAGNDTLDGGAGNDVISGGSGIDTIVLSDSSFTISPVADVDPVTAGNQPGWTITTAGGGTDSVSGVEIIDKGGAGNILLVGGGGFATIQAAVDAASDGDTVFVAAGTYAELVTVNKDITIAGLNAGIPAGDPRNPETIVDGGFYIGSAGATLDGLTVLGGGPLGGDSAGINVAANDVTLQNLILEGDGTAAIGLLTTYNITGLALSGSLVTGWDAGTYFNPGTQFTATGNSFADNGNAIVGDDWGAGTLIDGNSFTGSAGAHVGYGSSDSVEDVGAYFGTGNVFGPAPRVTGIYLYGDGTPGGQEVSGTDYSDYMLGYESVPGSGDGAIFHGEGGNDYIDAGSGDDTLDGGTGADTMVGGTGDDIYIVDDAGDVVTEASGEGTDEIRTGLSSYSLATRPDVENLTGAGGNQSLTGNDSGNRIDGGAGDDSIDGGAGVDTAYYAGPATIAQNGTGWTVTDSGGTDTLSNVEQIDDGGAGKTLLVGNGGYSTIQEAIDAASDGDSILVASGTYAENLDVDKDVTILGPNRGIAGTAARGAEAVIDGQIVINAAGATLDGFRLVGAAAGPLGTTAVEVKANDFTLSNSVLDGSGEFAIFVGLVTGLDIGRNLIRGYGVGAYLSGGNTSGSIHDNRFQGDGGPATGMANGINSETSHVLIANNAFDGLYSGSLTLFPFGPDSVDLQTYVTGNTITNTPVARPVQIYPTDLTHHILGTDFNEAFIGDYGVAGPLSFDGRGGDDKAWGSEQGDTLAGGTGIDELFGNGGDDNLAGGDQNDTLHGGAGNDSADGGNNNDIVNGDSGDDVLTGGAGVDTLNGGDDNDTLNGGSGSDTLNGEAGNDTMHGGAGNDALNGGSGTDTAVYDHHRGDYSIGMVTGAGGRIVGFSSVSDNEPSNGNDGADALGSVERVQFSNRTLDATMPVQLFDQANQLIGTFTSIQAAINGAQDNYTIRLAAGVYDEDLVIDKGVRILGARQLVAGTAAPPARDPADGVGESTIVGHAKITAEDNVSLIGLRFLNDGTTTGGGPSNPTLQILTGGGSQGHLISNSIFWSTVAGGANGVDDRAISATLIAGGQITLTGNFISGSSQGLTSTASWGRGVWMDGGGVSLSASNNIIEWTRTGMSLDGAGGSVYFLSDNGLRDLGTAFSMATTENGLVEFGNTFRNVGTEYNFRNIAENVNFDAGLSGNTLQTVGTGNDSIVILGGSGNDTLTGTEGADYIDANNRPGHLNVADTDVVDGAGGNDILFGRFGADTLSGGDGQDMADGGEGDDSVNGGAGDDILAGGAGDDSLSGGAGDDSLDGGSGVDTALVGSGATYTPTGTNWTVTSSDGTDTLTNVEIVDSGSGAKTLLVGSGGFATIQEAVDAASDGDTILVAGGTYVEQVTVEGIENLTILGVEGAVVTIKAPADLIETARSSGDREIHAVLTAKDSVNLTVQNIDVDGDGRGNTVDEGGGAGQANFYGIFYRNSSGSLFDVNITGVRDPYPGGTLAGGQPIVDGVQRGVGLVVDNDSLLGFTMVGGSISDFQKNGAVFNRADLSVAGVTITGGGAQTIIAQNGIQVANSTGSISANSISGIGYAGPADAYSGAILSSGNTNLNIVGNAITGANSDSTAAKVVGIWVYQTGAPNSGGMIAGNSISNVDYGIDVTGDLAPDSIQIENNIIANIDGTDNDPVGVGFAPNPALLTAHDVDGSNGNDNLAGGAGNDILSALGGDDVLTGNGGDDMLDGGDGTEDVAVYDGPRGGYDVVTVTEPGGRATGFSAVGDTDAGNGDEGDDSLSGVERLRFGDLTLDLADPVHLFDGGGQLVGTFGTIQAAIDSAQDGSTIVVAAGTYVEQLTIADFTGLTLKSAGGGAVIVKAPALLAINAASETFGEPVRAVIAVSDSTGVAISGIDVDGSFAGDTSPGSNGDELTGIGYFNASGSIADVDIDNVGNSQSGGLFGLQHGSGLFIDGGTTPGLEVSVTGSSITDFQKTGAIVYGVTVNFTGNTITGIGGTGLTAQNGLQIARSEGVVDGNTISGFGYSGPSVSGTGIIAYEPTGPLSITDNVITGAGAAGSATGLDLTDVEGVEVVVTGNSFNDLDYGIAAYSFLGGTTGLDTDPLTSGNSFSGIGIFGVYFAPEESVGAPFTTLEDFEESGSQFADYLAGSDGDDSFSGLAGDDILTGNGGNDSLDGGTGIDTAVYSGPVTVTRNSSGWTVTGADGTDTLTSVEIVDQAGASNFLLVGNGGYSTIQEAIDAAENGDTILVAAGTYVENLDVDKDVTILGPNSGIAGTATRGAEAVIDGQIAVNAAGVTIDGVKIVGAAPGPYVGQNNAVVVNSNDFTLANSVLSGTNGTAIYAGQVFGFDISNNLITGYSGGVSVFSGNATGSIHDNLFQGDGGPATGLNVGVYSQSTHVTIADNAFDGIRSNSLVLFPTGVAGPVDLQDYVTGNTITDSGVPHPVLVVPGPVTSILGTDHAESFIGEEQAVFGVSDAFSFDGRGGDDLATGGDGGDTFAGGSGDDELRGNLGDDRLTGGLGDDSLNGGGEVDTAVYSGPSSGYVVDGIKDSAGRVTVFTAVTDRDVGNGDEGTDTLVGIEILEFGDSTFDAADPVQLFDSTGNLVGTFGSIQAAVDAASDDYTIRVAAGTYDEDLTIDVGVTILGAGAGDAVSGRDAAGGAGETNIVGRAQVTATDNVTLDGLRFLNDSTTTGGGSANPTLQFQTGGGAAGHLVTNSIFWSTVTGGSADDRAISTVVIADGLIRITDNFISGTSQSQFGNASWGRAIWFDGGGVDLVVTGNLIEWSRTGLNLDLSGDSTAQVSDNSFRGLGTGIALGVDSDGLTVSSNDHQRVGTDFSFRNLTTGVTFNAATAIGALVPVGDPNDLVVILGGSGNDGLTGTEGADAIDGNNSPSNPGAADSDVLTGLGGNDQLFGRGGNDTLDGGTGDDSMTGGTGDDIYVVDSAGDSVSEASGEGTDEVRTTLAAYTLAAALENLTGLGNVNQSLNGNSSDNVIDGGLGADSMTGGAGNDIYVVDNAGDTVTELAGEGTDEIRTNLAAYSLAALANVENLTGTAAGGQTLTGNGSVNVITGASGNDVIDGGAGADSLRGGLGNDLYFVDSGDLVVENSGEGIDEVRTALATYVLAANVENLTATSNVTHDFRGNSGNNVVTGGSAADLFRMYDGGDDTVLAGAGADNIFFIASLTGADVINGGADRDTLVLQGNYTGGLSLTANITEIEEIAILGGGNTNFGAPGNERYDYVLVSHNSNFAAGVQARINASALLPGEDFTFDGSAETDATLVVYGGQGKDTLIGGHGNDVFIYGADRFAAGDTVNGGPGGYDGIFFRGNYTIDFNAPGYFGLMTSIENMTLTSITDERYARGGDPIGFDYDITLADNQLLAGVELTVSGTFLTATETMAVDGSLELDGRFRFFGGRAGDTLKGGAQNDLLHGFLGTDQLTGNGGADIFRFDSTADSNSTSMDHILDFTPGTDRIDLSRTDADSNAAGNQAFSWIGSNAFSGTAGQLRAYQQGGSWFVEGDTNGDGAADLVVQLTLQGPTPLGAGDFIL